jgi:hypothetical protein
LANRSAGTIRKLLKGIRFPCSLSDLYAHNPQATLSRDIQALQLALNAGDLTAVKAAFDRMQQDTQQIAKAQQQTQQKSAAQSAIDDSTNSALTDPKTMAAKVTGNLIDVYA